MAVAVVALAGGATACTTTKETTTMPTQSGSSTPGPLTQAEAKDQLHADMDRLVASVGTLKKVQSDASVPCNPGNDAAGFAWTYAAVVTVDPAAASAAMDAAAQAMSERGYQVGRSPRTDEVDLTFRRPGFDLDATFFPGKSEATVGGSAPCLKEKN